MSMHNSRSLAMQLLFLWDTSGQSDPEMTERWAQEREIDPDERESGLRMAHAAWEQREIADRWVERLAPLWPSHRQPAVDRNLLRLAIWELTNTDTPVSSVLDEAIELAREFSTAQSASFVNGVLDAVSKEQQALVSLPAVTSPNPDPVIP